MPGKGFFIVIGSALAIALGIWGYTALHNRGDKTPFQQKADQAHETTARAESLVVKTDTLWLPARTQYLAAKTRNSGSPQAREVAVACDSALAAQDRRIAARDTLTTALKRELNVWQNKPGPPRLQAYGEALYDVMHSVPVGRVGATFRVLGPISLSAAGEYGAPPAGKSDPAFRATVGIKYTF